VWWVFGVHVKTARERKRECVRNGKGARKGDRERVEREFVLIE